MFKDYDDPALLARIQELLTAILSEFDRVCTEIGTPYVVYGGTALGAVRHGGFIPWDDDVDVCMLRRDYERFLSHAPGVLKPEYMLANSRVDAEFPNMFSVLGLRDTEFISEFIKDSPYKMQLSIDIFPLDKVPQEAWRYRLQAREAWFWGRMMYLQGTPRPYLSLEPAATKAVHTVTGLVYQALKLLRVGPTVLQKRWEKAARRFEQGPGARHTDFTDMNPMAWEVAEVDLFPSVSAPFGDIEVQLPNNYDAILTRGYGDYMELPPENKRKNHQPYHVDLGSYTEVDPD